MVSVGKWFTGVWVPEAEGVVDAEADLGVTGREVFVFRVEKRVVT